MEIIKKKPLIRFAILFGLVAASSTTGGFAAELGFVLGGGTVYHSFAEADDSRKGTDTFLGQDEISVIIGIEIYGEYFFQPDFAFGLKVQSLAWGFEYISSDYVIEREVTLENNVGYINYLTEIGFKDLRLGITAGYGHSKYTASSQHICHSGASDCTDYNDEETSNGSIAIIGFMVDWGRELIDIRLGYNSVSASHPNIKSSDGTETEIKASGGQTFIDFRFAF